MAPHLFLFHLKKKRKWKPQGFTSVRRYKRNFLVLLSVKSCIVLQNILWEWVIITLRKIYENEVNKKNETLVQKPIDASKFPWLTKDFNLSSVKPISAPVEGGSFFYCSHEKNQAHFQTNCWNLRVILFLQIFTFNYTF